MPDLQPYYTWIFMGLAGIVLLVAVFLIAKLFRSGVQGRRGSRLGILEYHDIDKSRRLVLIRRDDIEHLILIGGHQDLVVESGIETGLSMARKSPSSVQQVDPPVVLRPAPRPAVFGGRRPNLRPVDNTIDNTIDTIDDNQPA